MEMTQDKSLVRIILSEKRVEFLLTHLSNVIEGIERDMQAGYLTVPTQNQAEYLTTRREEKGMYQQLYKTFHDFYDSRYRKWPEEEQ